MSTPVQNAIAFLELAIEARETGSEAACDAFLAHLYKTRDVTGLTRLSGALVALLLLTLKDLDQDPRLYISQMGLALAMGEGS